MTNIRKIGTVFNHEADLYHIIRPRYPVALFDALEKFANLLSPAQIVEIGAGTGQATIPLAQRGHIITAIEIGARLAQIAQRELRAFPNVTVVNNAFEDMNLPHYSYDLLFAATAFHWIKPGFAFRKSRQLLKPNGYLAIVHTHHTTDGKGDVFFHASQPIYQKYFPRSNNIKSGLPNQHDLQPWKLDETLFELTHFETFPLVIPYTAAEYAQLLNTYSPTLRLPATKRACFLADIERLIIREFSGILQKYFCISLTIARPR